NVLDEFTHECLAIRVARKLKAIDVIDVLSDLFILRGIPAHIRSDTNHSSSPRRNRTGSRLPVPRPPPSTGAAPGRPATSRASMPRFRDELLNGEIFYTLREAQIVIESWRRHYNTIRPHASIGYKPPAPEVFVPAFAAWDRLRRPRWRNHQP